MTTRINTASPSDVNASPTARRVTPAPAQPFKSVLRAGAQAVVNGAEGAVQKLPGGPVLAAAVRTTGSSSVHPGHSPEGSGGTADATGAANNGGQAQLEGALSQQAEQNMYFLELQARISAESRAYTATSNVLKARHETVKNAINNIR